MKLQNLAIIFLVIIIPLIMILAYYLHLQQDTLELQAEYDTKLAEATKEGIKAFEVNTVDWSEWISKKTNQTRRNEAMATINTFLTSLANNLNISGTAKEYMVNYIPAVAVTMYDGYYIYSPTYAPISIVNSDGVQLYYDKENDELTTESSYGANLPIYKPKAGVMAKQSTYIQTNGIDETIEFVTDITEAETEYKHMLSNYMSYTARYRNNTGTTNVIVNYTLDNRIYVYGKVGGDTVEKDGYLVYFDNTAVMPRINVTSTDPKDDSAIQVFKGVKDAKYSNTSIDTEILQEQVLYSQNGSEDLETFKYVYDINHEKLYYDEKEDNFFTIDTSNRERQYISNDTSIKAGDVGCRYKSISVLWGSTDNTTEYKKIYQVLNGKDKGKWYIDIKEDSDDAKDASAEEIDTEIKGTKLKELGLDDPRFSTIYRDYSAISYYVEAYAFTNWARQNLTGVKQEVYNEDLNQYDFKDIEVEGNVVDIFDITVDNDPEKAYSPIVLHKKEITKEHIITNLNLSISNYSRGTYEFKLPVLTNNDWDQVFSNISLITFFQGVPIGLKYYNNYAIATSKTNREYVDPGELYFSGEDPNYHRVYCEKCGNTIYTGYRSVEYVLREFVKRDSNNNIIGTPIYYYLHDRYEGIKNKDSETACYYCIVNKENFVETSDSKIAYTQAKSYNEALARERYYQQAEIRAKLYENIQISVIKKKLAITNTDIIFILDDSGSMTSDFTDVENTCCDILDVMIGQGLSTNFYIGFIRFSSNASTIGKMTQSSELGSIKSKIKSEYGKGGGTNFINAFNEAINMINKNFVGRTNQRVIIFMTDGNGTYDRNQVAKLKDNYGVDQFYAISYRGGTSQLDDMISIFAPNSMKLESNASNLLDTFKNILYKINASTPVEVETVDGRLDISDMIVSAQQPMKITVTKNGIVLKVITITQYPTSSEGVIIIDNGKMYLSVAGLAEACGLTDFQGVSVSIEYFSS